MLTPTVSTAKLCEALGVTKQRISVLERRGTIQRETDGQWDVEKVRAALAANLDARQNSANPDQPPTLQKGTIAYETYRLTRERADRAALERAEIEGSLLKVDEVRKAWDGMIAAARTKLLAIGDEICEKLAAETNSIRCREMVNVKVKEALADLANA